MFLSPICLIKPRPDLRTLALAAMGFQIFRYMCLLDGKELRILFIDRICQFLL